MNVKKLAEQSGMTQYVAPNNKSLERFAELIVKELVSTMRVEGCDFYHNIPNDYGCVTVKYFVDGNAHLMCGEEIEASYHDGIRGSGMYRLNDLFVQHLLRKHFGDE